jgi:hypothetical protein
VPGHHGGDTAAGEGFRLTVDTALHQLPAGVLRDLARRWPHDGNRAERIVAEAIDEALLRPHRPVRRRPAAAAGRQA